MVELQSDNGVSVHREQGIVVHGKYVRTVFERFRRRTILLVVSSAELWPRRRIPELSGNCSGCSRVGFADLQRLQVMNQSFRSCDASGVVTADDCRSCYQQQGNSHHYCCDDQQGLSHESIRHPVRQMRQRDVPLR